MAEDHGSSFCFSVGAGASGYRTMPLMKAGFSTGSGLSL